jgi:SAM-dependent methyltransferase
MITLIVDTAPLCRGAIKLAAGMVGPSMREFWDARAAEDPYYFVDNRLEYGDPDLQRFWDGGPEGVDLLLGDLGVAISPTDDVVEIGCGVGRMTRVLAARAASVRAIDVSERMIHLARQHNGGLDNVEWVVGDGRRLAGIETASADACHSDVVFQHIPDPDITLGYVREMGRVLRPGGWAAFQISNAPAIHVLPALTRARVAARAALGQGPHGQNDPRWRGSAVDLDRLQEVAHQCGMRTERVTGAGTQYCRVLLRNAG